MSQWDDFQKTGADPNFRANSQIRQTRIRPDSALFQIVLMFVQFIDFFQQCLESLLRGAGGFCGIGHMSASPEATICECEGLVCRHIDDGPNRFFLQYAMRRLRVWHSNWIGRKRRIIKCVPCVGEFGHLNILGRPSETLKIGPARSDFDPVVGPSVKDADWVVGHPGIVDVSRDAGRI